MNSILWSAQILLATCFIWAGTFKLLYPIEKLSAMWPWTSQVSPALVFFTGIIDSLGAIGLILPSLLCIKPVLTPITAIAIIVLMTVAVIFHIVRGEAAGIGPNIAFALIATFIAWGRLSKAPLKSNESDT